MVGLAAVAVGGVKFGQDWRSADRASTGIAPDPASTPEALVQIYAARAFNWRGALGVHTWIATKERDAGHFIADMAYDEVLGGWLAKEMVRDVYLTDRINPATVLLGRAVTACLADDVPEIQSLGRTLRKWWTEILNHHRTGASNGPTEALNLCVKKVKRAGHGFRCFDHYRLRVLLHAGGCDWSGYTTPARPIRTRSPH